jgi:hypothetical protein
MAALMKVIRLFTACFLTAYPPGTECWQTMYRVETTKGTVLPKIIAPSRLAKVVPKRNKFG